MLALLMQTIMVVSISTTITLFAFPTLQHAWQNRQTELVVHDFLHTLQRARQEAIRRHATVVVSPRCDNNWNQGWVVFIDAPEDGPNRIANVPTLFISQDIPATVFVGADATSSAFADTHDGSLAPSCTPDNTTQRAATYHLRFDHQGRATRTHGGFMNGSISIQRQDNQGAHYRIVLSISGRARICRIEASGDNAC
jgi:Tfp pilus assembly protein FimT